MTLRAKDIIPVAIHAQRDRMLMADTSEAQLLEPYWYAIYTRSRHEKAVAAQLSQRSVDCFLPLYDTVRKWKNGRFHVQLPLFPGYLFVRIALQDRLNVLQVPGVVNLVGFKGVPAPLPQADIEKLRDALSKGAQAQPHPYLNVGARVRIKSGPLEGMQGILLRKKGHLRVVVSVDLIMRSIAVDVDTTEVEPVR
jgi:transcription elongation factor/antiterminator RfaH